MGAMIKLILLAKIQLSLRKVQRYQVSRQESKSQGVGSLANVHHEIRIGHTVKDSPA